MRTNEGLDFLQDVISYSQLDIQAYQYFHNLLQRRTIVFNEEVDTDIVESLMMPLLEFEKDDSEEPVTLILATPGGSTLAGLSVCNIIDNYKKKLNIIVPNYALSMGFYITIAGRDNPNVKKYAYPYTFFLLHAGETGASGESGSVKDLILFYDHIDEMIQDYVLSHTSITKEDYLTHIRKQWYFTAEEAKNVGIIDYIIGKDVPEVV